MLIPPKAEPMLTQNHQLQFVFIILDFIRLIINLITTTKSAFSLIFPVDRHTLDGLENIKAKPLIHFSARLLICKNCLNFIVLK